MQRTNSLNSGHRACQGCGEALGARYAIDAAMRATDNQLVAVNATGCLEVFSTPYPETRGRSRGSIRCSATPRRSPRAWPRAMRVTGRTATRVVAQGGDGGTTDIGFGCLSGMFERNDDVLYICYDNEAYMNTGVQRSSATPPTARTATTPAVGKEPGNVFGTGKNVPLIAMAHLIPVCRDRERVANLRDLGIQGDEGDGHPRRAVHPHPRPVPAGLGLGTRGHDQAGARSPSSRGLFPLFEAEHGEITGRTTIRRKVPVDGIPRSCRSASRTCSDRRRTSSVSRSIQANGRPHHRQIRPARLANIMEKPYAIHAGSGSSLANKTGSWRTSRPVYLDRLPPCNHACPAGENIQGWLYPCESRATTKRRGAC